MYPSFLQVRYGTSHSRAGSKGFVWTCYNCGEEGHGIRACLYPNQPSERIDEIRAKIDAGEPIPDDLRPPGYNSQARVTEIPAKMLLLEDPSEYPFSLL